MSIFVRYLFVFLLAVTIVGCLHERTTSVANITDVGELIETKSRYSPRYSPSTKNISLNGKGFAVGWNLYCFANNFQPKVFSDNLGVPFNLSVEEIFKVDSGGWTALLCGMSLGVLPYVGRCHEHRRYTISFDGERIPIQSFEVCTRQGQAFTNFLSPLSLLFFDEMPEMCFESGRKYSCVSPGDTSSVEEQAVAYGIACKLKELEDMGYIDAGVKARQLIKSFVDGVALVNGISLPFKIAKLECDAERDYLYRFDLILKSGGCVTLSENNMIRFALREAMRKHYALEHTDVNPRTLSVDFVEYAESEGHVTGVVALLSISPQLVFYDAATHKGRIVVKIGENQFEEVRRWMRKNIEDIARDSNIVKEGNTLPSNVRFYIGRETLGDNGVFEMEFKTE